MPGGVAAAVAGPAGVAGVAGAVVVAGVGDCVQAASSTSDRADAIGRIEGMGRTPWVGASILATAGRRGVNPRRAAPRPFIDASAMFAATRVALRH
jgi:hypothetical protein